MNRLRRRRHSLEHDNVHRWLISYADYMTLLFALFVVLYAMAMVNEKPFESITESIGRVFQADDILTKNVGHGDDLLMVNSLQTKKRLYGNNILDVAGPELVSGEQDLSNISDTVNGSNLDSLEEELSTALYDIVESGYAQLQVDGDWLEIELNSGLLFPSGSSSPTNSAQAIIGVINDVIGNVSNFVRVRGYTDNQPINNEVYSSNWELSVHRATAILRLFEALELDPARMAIEGYGQYYPSADNTTAQGRARNRKVVVAISKYGLEKSNLLVAPTISLNEVENIKQNNQPESDNSIKVIRLDNGGIRITTRNDDEKNNQNNNTNIKQQDNNDN
ncbi:flagellar motor protein MotB [Colwellia sp. RSH04]|uniref:flagellar motor protein MotB n=1 Tax=Colwellia sp. RSH04 TaxID=2305464 RepID=UPI000E5876F9|nr:flagellar motor protein MotB [Colwellia sp. RSH04]RHW76004.1 chemotaxis protein MotB [Colwellia sp. RSH04]